MKVRASLGAWSLAMPWRRSRRCFPPGLALAGATSQRGSNYLAWQLFRRANHPFDFYLTTVPIAIGLLLLACGPRRLVLDRQTSTGASGCCARWAIVPIVFFTLTPMKGFQYLLAPGARRSPS